MRVTEHAPRGRVYLLERRHGLAEIVKRGAGVLVERPRVDPPQFNTETYCRSDTWVLATRRAADVYVHATMREFHRRTGCDQARAALINALAGTGAKVHVHKRDAHESVCVECKLYHTLKVQGVEACAGVADDFIARQGAIRDDGSVDFSRVVGDGSIEELVRGDRASVIFEHPVSGRCGATAAEVLARPRD